MHVCMYEYMYACTYVYKFAGNSTRFGLCVLFVCTRIILKVVRIKHTAALTTITKNRVKIFLEENRWQAIHTTHIPYIFAHTFFTSNIYCCIHGFVSLYLLINDSWYETTLLHLIALVLVKKKKNECWNGYGIINNEII